MEISYNQYRKQMEEISYEKKLLNELVKKLKIASSEYHNYLLHNPFKKEYTELTIKVFEQRNKLIKMIPEWK